jgi:hypothetical protein
MRIRIRKSNVQYFDIPLGQHKLGQVHFFMVAAPYL